MEQCITGFDCPDHAAGMRFQLVLWNVPGAAMDQQYRRSRTWVGDCRHDQARGAGRKSLVPVRAAGLAADGLRTSTGSGLVRW